MIDLNLITGVFKIAWEVLTDFFIFNDLDIPSKDTKIILACDINRKLYLKGLAELNRLRVQGVIDPKVRVTLKDGTKFILTT